MTAPGRRLALDYGRRRIGLAVCDALGITTRPLPMLVRTNLAADLEAIAACCTEQEAQGIVVGIPFNLDGEAGRAADEVSLFARVLRERVELPVDEVDERLSTRAAHAFLADAGHRHAKRKARLDSTAAMLILRAWLARRKHAGI
jgi:putative Holliday junction resolvase